MSAHDLNTVQIPFIIDDVSTEGQIYVPVTKNMGGRIVGISTALNGAIGTADVDLTAKINGTAVTNGVITIAYTSSAAGDVDSCSPSAANEVAEGDVIEVETDGASSNTVRVFGTIEIKR